LDTHEQQQLFPEQQDTFFRMARQNNGPRSANNSAQTAKGLGYAIGLLIASPILLQHALLGVVSSWRFVDVIACFVLAVQVTLAVLGLLRCFFGRQVQTLLATSSGVVFRACNATLVV
jgi:hypothetical protein